MVAGGLTLRSGLSGLRKTTAETTLRANLEPRSALVSSVRRYADSTSTPDKSRHVITFRDDEFPAGFSVAATHAGIKKKQDALDLGVLVSTSGPASAAACFTRNVFKAAPVQVSTQILAKGSGKVRAVIVNSGCANAVTGQRGMKDAWAMSKEVSDGVKETSSEEATDGTLVLSTGVIGQHLPIEKITSAVPSVLNSLSPSFDSWMSLARAFMTTDTFPKLRTLTYQLNGETYKMAGIDKGAGMIHPNMGPPHGTLLGVVVTDAPISPSALQSALAYAVDRSFNSISVDGDMSTNDTILALANGAAAGPDNRTEITESDPGFDEFKETLRTFSEDLAKLVVRDGEGATKFVTVRVENAPSYEVAKKVASSVSTSSLFKTAMYGQDANWGRILCAVGYTDLPDNSVIKPSQVSVTFIPPAHATKSEPLKLLTNGEPEPNIDEERALEILKEEDLEILIDLGHTGDVAKATYWTCDFSHDYVTINGSYRS